MLTQTTQNSHNFGFTVKAPIIKLTDDKTICSFPIIPLNLNRLEITTIS